MGIRQVSHWPDTLYFAYERGLPAANIEGGLKRLVSHVRGQVPYCLLPHVQARGTYTVLARLKLPCNMPSMLALTCEGLTASSE